MRTSSGLSLEMTSDSDSDSHDSHWTTEICIFVFWLWPTFGWSRSCKIFTRAMLCVSAVFAAVACLTSDCLSHAGIVSKRLNLFRPSGSPMILVFSTPCADTQYQGELRQWGDKYTRVWKLAIFDWNRRLSAKQCEIGRWLLRTVQTKS